VYPNPSQPNEDLTLVVNGSEDPINIRLMDMMGKSYYDNTVSPKDYSEIHITPTDQLTKGMYIILIQQGEKTQRKTLIVKD
jgi:hypothetical protein